MNEHRCPDHPHADTMASPGSKPGWGRYHRCRAGHGFYVLRGKVTHVTQGGRGGPVAFDAPCGECGGKTYATHTYSTSDGLVLDIRQCWEGHRGLYLPDTRGYVCPSERPAAYDGPCVECGRERNPCAVRNRVRWCSACKKRRQRARARRDTQG